MIEVTIHHDADRPAVVAELRKFGQITERSVIGSVVSLETSMENMDQIRRINGVIDVEDGEKMATGFAQTHVLTRLPERNDSSDMSALQILDFEPQRVRHDLLYADTTITRDGSIDGTGIVVGCADNLITDSGHDEFGARFIGEIYNGYPSDDGLNHGNNVACVAVGASYGIAPGAELVSARCLNASNAGTITITINALDAIGDRHIAQPEQHVANASFGANSTSYTTVVTDLATAGCPIFAAAGNNALNLETNNVQPAEAANAFAVGGLTLNKYVHLSSNYGSPVDGWASYGPWYMVGLNGTFNRDVGTSFGCPAVAGIAALLLQGRTKMTSLSETTAFYNEIKSSITKTDCFNPRNYTRDTSIKRINYRLPRSEYTITRA